MKRIIFINGILWIFLLFAGRTGWAQNTAGSNRNAGLFQREIIPSIATWNMDSAVIELAATYTPFKVLADLRNIRKEKDILDDAVHDEIKERATYAKGKGISLIADLDVRLALSSFEARYELQQMLVVREIPLKGNDTIAVSFVPRSVNDHYHKRYPIRAGAFLRAFRYSLTSGDLIDPASLEEISDKCMVGSATNPE